MWRWCSPQEVWGYMINMMNMWCFFFFFCIDSLAVPRRTRMYKEGFVLETHGWHRCECPKIVILLWDEGTWGKTGPLKTREIALAWYFWMYLFVFSWLTSPSLFVLDGDTKRDHRQPREKTFPFLPQVKEWQEIYRVCSQKAWETVVSPRDEIALPQHRPDGIGKRKIACLCRAGQRVCWSAEEEAWINVRHLSYALDASG